MDAAKATGPNTEWCGEYGPICTQRPEDYSYYGAMNIDWGDISNYECYHKLGRGKYSEVFLGYCKANNSKSVIKILKPVKAEKIYREIKILQTLWGGLGILSALPRTTGVPARERGDDLRAGERGREPRALLRVDDRGSGHGAGRNRKMQLTLGHTAPRGDPWTLNDPE